jgi:hypothetical protein
VVLTATVAGLSSSRVMMRGPVVAILVARGMVAGAPFPAPGAPVAAMKCCSKLIGRDTRISDAAFLALPTSQFTTCPKRQIADVN